MSWQAFEAVQDHSKIDDHTALSIMYVIARYADATGAVGSGGRATSPSIDTIAAKSRCHRNTVLNWLPKLEATGELTIERLGSGRGSWNRYTINLPMPEENNGTGKDVPLSKDMVQEMVQNLGVMVQDAMAEMKVMVQGMVHNGTSHVGLDTEDTKDNIYIPPLPRPVARMVTALSVASKTPLTPKYEKDFEDGAYYLIGRDFVPEQVENFPNYWREKGWGGASGKPTLEIVLQEMDNCVKGIDTRRKGANSNGHEKVNTATDSAGGFYG